MIRFNCPQCDKAIQADDRHAGRQARCRGCGALLRVPQPAAESAPEPALEPEPEPSEPALDFRRKPEEPEGLDMTPMVDVTFLLLIFFMVTAAFSLQKSIQIPTPDPSDAASQQLSIEQLEDEDDYVIVQVDADDEIWVNESLAASHQALLSKLREARRGPPGTVGRGPSKMRVLANGEARHETVVEALDAGTAVGMEEVQLATVEDDF